MFVKTLLGNQILHTTEAITSYILAFDDISQPSTNYHIVHIGPEDGRVMKFSDDIYRTVSQTLLKMGER